MRRKVLILTPREYEALYNKTRHQVNGKDYWIRHRTVLGTVFHRAPKIIIALELEPMFVRTPTRRGG